MEEIRMKQRVMALVLAGILAAAATACGSTGSTSGKNNDAKPTVAYKDMKVGETETDLKADLKILTNRTDLVDSDFQDYISKFNAIYPIMTPMPPRDFLPETGATSAASRLPWTRANSATTSKRSAITVTSRIPTNS